MNGYYSDVEAFDMVMNDLELLDIYIYTVDLS